jgi:hypothetical protein
MGTLINDKSSPRTLPRKGEGYCSSVITSARLYSGRMDTPTMKPSVFVPPTDFVKGRRARVVVFNDYAQAILEELRGPTRSF